MATTAIEMFLHRVPRPLLLLSLLPKVVVSKHTHKNRRVRSQIHWETPNTHLFSASISAILELRRIYVVLGVLKFTVSTRLRKRNTHIHTHSHVKRIFCTCEGDNVDVV